MYKIKLTEIFKHSPRCNALHQVISVSYVVNSMFILAIKKNQ